MGIFRKEGNIEPGTYQKPQSVVLSERIYEDYKSAHELWEKRAREDEDFSRGAQITREEEAYLEANQLSPVVVNIIEPSVEQAIALLTANNPRFTSTGREDSDVKTGRVFSNLMEYIWQVSDGNTHLKYAIRDYYVKGRGVLMAYYDPFADYGKGEIKITSVNAYDIYIDPNSQDPYIRDASNVIIRKIMTAEQILNMYPDFRERLELATPTEESNAPKFQMAGMEGQTEYVESMLHLKYEVLDRYTKIRLPKYKIYDNIKMKEEIFENEERLKAYLQKPAVILVQEGKENVINEEEEVIFYLNLAEEGKGKFHFVLNPQTQQPEIVPGAEEEDPNAIPGSEGLIKVIDHQFLLDTEELVLDTYLETRIKRVLSIGGVLYFEDIMPISNYPFVTFMNHHNRTPFPLSDVRMVRGLQRQINKIEMLIIAHASNSTNVKWWTPKGAIDKNEIEEKLNQAGTAVLEYDPELGAPIPSNPIPLPNELYKNKADKIAEIERVLGIYPLMQGAPGGAPETYRGIVTLDEYGQRRIRSKRDDIEQGLNVLAKVIVEMIQYYYTEPKVIRLIQPNNLPTKSIAINQIEYDDFGKVIRKINDVTVGKYDVIVVSGSTLPTNRFALAEYYKELLQIGAIDQQEFLMKTEVADVEGVLERAGQFAQMQRYIQELEQKVKELQGDLQTLQRENIHLNKRVEVEKFKSSLAEPKEKMRKASQLYETLLQNDYQSQKSLIKQNNGGNNGKY